MSILLAVFDIAGTTVADDNAVAAAFQKAFEQHGINITEDEVKPLMGYKKTEAIRLMLNRHKQDDSTEKVNAIHESFVNEMNDYYEYSPAVRPMPDAESVFLQLREKGIRIALNTGFPRVIADTIVSRLQWKERGLIDDYIASDEVAAGRPGPFMIRELMRRAQVTDAAQVVKIGDTEVDVAEGRQAGCSLVVAVTTGAFTREQLEPHKPDEIVDNLSAIPHLIFSRA